MSLRVTEKVRHHTTDEVAESVRETLAIAADVGLTDEERTLLLPGILNLVSATHLQIEDSSAAAAILGRGLHH